MATARSRPEGPPVAPSPQPKSAFKVADDAMEALDDKVRLTLVDRHAHKLGMATIFSAVLKIPKTLS